MNPLYARVAQRARHRCEYCHAPEVIFNFPFEVEHVIPTSQQGNDDETNTALACRACNLKKSDHVTGIDESTQAEIHLFNPREDRWEVHFQVDTETGEILGLSTMGRATVARLDLNAPAQLQARQQWMRLKLYP
jgi:HNH endonuclease